MEKQKRNLKRVAVIQIEPYLAEYISAKYKTDEYCGGVKIPATTDLYFCLWHLMGKRSKDQQEEPVGNLKIALPCRRSGNSDGPWKDPAYYNYFSLSAVREIENCIRMQFNFELHRVLLENEEFGKQQRNLDIIYDFIHTYELKSISSDALLKNYYRYRNRLRQKKVRGYKKKTF